MAKKRTSKQRNQENIAKNAGKNSARAKSKMSAAGIGEKQDDVNNDAPRNISRNSDPISAPPKGLSNLGNTCFFNSVMQNLCRTSGLLHVLTEAAKLTEITFKDENITPLTCQLPMMPKLSESLLNFLITMGEINVMSNGSSKNRARTESPRVLFSQICSVSPRFRTYQQQDSQELLQCLLDGIKSEEIKRRKQAILMKLGLLGKKAAAVDDEMKEKVKTYGRIACRIPTVVDIIFRGELVSSVLCDECGRITQVHEEFLDIPLPIAETHSLHHSHYVSSKKTKNKTEKEVDKDTSSDSDEVPVQGTSFKADSSSKHAKKKQREQERKNKHKRKRTKSQTMAQPNQDISPMKLDDAEQKSASQITSSIDENPSVNGNTPDSVLIQSDRSANPKQQENIEEHQSNICDHNHNSSNNENQTLNQECDNVETKFTSTVTDSSKIIEGSVTDICKDVDKISLATSALSLGTEDTKFDKSIDVMAQEIVSNIVLAVCSEVGDNTVEKSGNVSSLARNIPCDYSHKIEDKTSLLGGKPIPTNGIGTATQVASDKDADSMASKNHSEDDAAQQKSDIGSSPSSGNDEKSDSENPSRVTPSLFETPVKRREVKFTGFCKKLPSSLSARYEPGKTECSVLTCLHKFTMAEMLTGNNKFGCEECTKRQNIGVDKPKTVYCNASKQMLIETPPLILTLQLKRFQQSGSNLRKLSKRVVIPPRLDLSSFCSNQARKYANENGEIWYNLYGIVEHSGSMSRGHYTAYVRVRPETKYFDSRPSDSATASDDMPEEQLPLEQWYHVSDTSVSKCTLERALGCNAYLIFYEREQY